MNTRRAAGILGWIVAWIVIGGAAQGASVACTTTIVADVVSRIAGEEIPVFTLFSPDADPHGYEPKPQDLVALQQADLVFINGLGLERSLVPLLENVGTPVLSLSDGLPGLVLDAPDPADASHAEEDPHVWFDPTLVVQWVDRIATALSDLEPPFAQVFHERAVAFQQELMAMDLWIRNAVTVIPERGRLLVTDHLVLGYFARRYGFAQVGAVFPSSSSLAEPSARDLVDLSRKIASYDVPAIFVGTTVQSALAEQIAADTGTILVFLYTGALSQPDGPAATYLDFLRYDVDAIVRALRSS